MKQLEKVSVFDTDSRAPLLEFGYWTEKTAHKIRNEMQRKTLMAKISDQPIAKREQSTDPERALIKRTVAVGATDDELEMFLYDCKRRGVHPLDKLLHFTKRSGKYTPIVSIDLMRSRAAETNEMAGSDDPVFLPGHGPKPESATVTVYRLTNGQRYAYTGTARWTEYYVNTPTWNKMPHVMLGKCAEAIALRKAFPAQLAGLYTREEMDQAGEDAPATLAQIKTITGGKTDYPSPAQQLAKSAATHNAMMEAAKITLPEEQTDEEEVNADPENIEETGAQTEIEPEQTPQGAFSHEWWKELSDADVIKTNVAAANRGWMPLLECYKSMPADLQHRWEKHKEHWKAIARRIEQDKMR